jgi:predicted nucleic acid-binding protein
MIVCLDADCTIYFVEQDPTWGPKVTARLAARLRAASVFNLKVPDCLHLAAAVEHGCGLFLTHDAPLKQCKDIPVEVLT